MIASADHDSDGYCNEKVVVGRHGSVGAGPMIVGYHK